MEVAELYFDERVPEGLPPVDLVRIVGVRRPTSDRAWKLRHTLSLDLAEPEDALFEQMGKSTRRQVRQAMTQDGLSVETLHPPTPEALTAFADYYDEFARSKALRPIFRPRLGAMARTGMLVLSRVSRDASPLVWHAYAATSGRALLLYSASLFRDYSDSAERNAIGRANRRLHWHDILWCKAAGLAAYDLGGIDVEGQDPDTRRIAEFKRRLGGRMQPSHTSTSALTARGRVITALLRLKRLDY